MKVTCHNKECKKLRDMPFTFEYNGKESFVDCPKCSSKIIIEKNEKNTRSDSKFRNKLRMWLIRHPSINPYSDSKNKISKNTGKDRLLPNFLIFGGTRSGGMTLQRYLVKHPTVICERNIHFFEYTITNNVNWYKTHFPTKKYKNKMEKQFNQNLTVGEQTGTYMFFPNVPSRVKEVIPNVKLIAILRNPIDMIFSRYNHMKNQGFEVSANFDEVIDMELKRINILEKQKEMKMDNPFFDNSMIFNYIRHGNYASRLEEWFKYFPKKQFLIFTNKELTKDPSKFTNKTFEFLDLEPVKNIEYIKHNVSDYKEKMNESTKKILEERFRPYNEKLDELLDRKLEW